MDLLNSLLNQGYLTETNVSIVAHFSQKWGVNTYDAVLGTRILSEQSLADAIADIFKLDRIYSFDVSDLDLKCLKFVNYKHARSLSCFTPCKDTDDTIQAFILNPLDRKVASFLNFKFEKYRFVILDKRLMIRSLEDLYPLGFQIPSLMNY